MREAPSREQRISGPDKMSYPCTGITKVVEIQVGGCFRRELSQESATERTFCKYFLVRARSPFWGSKLY